MKYSLDFIIRRDKINKSGDCPICLRYTYQRSFYRIPLGISINPEYWDSESYLPLTKTPHFKSIYKKMEELRESVQDKVEDFIRQTNFPPNIVELKSTISNVAMKNLKPERFYIKNLFEEFINFSKEGVIIRSSTLSIYNTTLKKWLEFEEFTSRKYEVKDVNFEVLERFSIYLKSQNLIHSTAGKYVKTMKTLFNSYVIQRKKIPMDIEFKKVKIDEATENEFIYLNQVEFEQLRDAVFYSQYKIKNEVVELTSSQKNVGRMFLFMCSTGLSFTDLLNLSYLDIKIGTEQLKLKEDDSKEDKIIYIKINRQKVKKNSECIIPLFGLTIELLISIMGQPIEFMGANVAQIPNSSRVRLLEKLLQKKQIFKKENNISDYRIFSTMANPVFNRQIKSVFKKIGLTETIAIKPNRNSNDTILVQKCDLISSHTGRRTYITLCLNAGIRADQLMKTTGHRKFETMRKYTKLEASSIHQEFINKLSKN